jgi:hypothetical protein
LYFQQKLLGLVEPSEDVNNSVNLRIGHKSLIGHDQSMYPLPMFFWLYYANRKGIHPAMVNGTLPLCTNTFEIKQDRFEVIRVVYNSEDLVMFTAGAEVFVHYNMSIPNF